MSFRPELVDWACLLQKKQETVLEAQTCELNVPRYRFFATCQVRLRNGMEPPKT